MSRRLIRYPTGWTLAVFADANRIGGQVDQDRHAVLAVDVQHVVGHLGDRRLGRVGLVGDRVVQELLDQRVDGLVEGRREEQPRPGDGRPGVDFGRSGDVPPERRSEKRHRAGGRLGWARRRRR